MDNRTELSVIREELRAVERRLRLFAAGLPRRDSFTRGAALRAVTLIGSGSHELDRHLAELAPVLCNTSGEMVA